MSNHTDEPLTVADLAHPQHGVARLAERLRPHLGPHWQIQVERGAFGIELYTDHGLRLAMRYTTADGQHQVAVTPVATGSHYLATLTMNLFLLPSQMAARLKTELIPEYRRRVAKDREAQLREDAERGARRGYLKAVAQRLGSDWRVAQTAYGLRVDRSRKGAHIFGEIGSTEKGDLYLDLHNLTPELVEHIVDGIAAQMDIHEPECSGSARKRPKRLSYLLELMVAHGYRIDKLDREHEKLFGTPLFKMDLGTYPGQPLVDFLLERQWALDKAIRVLELERERGGEHV